MKKLIFVLLLSSYAGAQVLTTVTATLQDSSGQIWSNAVWTAEFSKPVGGSNVSYSNGGHPITLNQTGLTNSSGAFTVVLDDNIVGVKPGGTAWRFTICPNANVAACNIITLTITGATVDISSQLNAILTVPVVNSNSIVARAYNDTEVNGAFGTLYINSASDSLKQCQNINCTGSGWVTVGGSGGGGSGTVGPGTPPQFAIYNGPTSIVGSTTFSDNGTVIVSTEPLSFTTTASQLQFTAFPSAAPAPVSGLPQLVVAGAGGTLGTQLFYSTGSTTGSNNIMKVMQVSPIINSTVMNTMQQTYSGTAPNTCAATNFPANARCVTFYTPGPNTGTISAALVGDGSANCLSGTGTYVTCGATGGVGGSGTAPVVPVFTAATTLGNSNITSTAQQIQIGSPTLIPSGTGGLVSGIFEAVDASTASCGGANTTPLSVPSFTTNLGCIGQRIQYNTRSATNTGVNAGLFVQSNGSTNSAGILGMGIYSAEAASFSIPETRAGYFEAFESVNATVTTRRGLMAFSGNGTGNVTATNEGIVAQTGAVSGSTNTNDYSIHCIAPNGTGTLTTHACLRIEPQGTGVEFQTGAHVFANLPACATAYEGSMASITDSTVTSGTITGGGTNHVFGYCNGSAWVIPGSGGTSPVGAGTSGQFAVYNSTSTVVGSTTFSDTGTYLNPTESFAGTATPLPTLPAATGLIGFSAAAQLIAAAPAGQPYIVPPGQTAAFAIPAIQINGTALSTNFLSFPTSGSPPTNSFRIAAARTNSPSTNTTTIIYNLQGDGIATDCALGTGVFGPCMPFRCFTNQISSITTTATQICGPITFPATAQFNAVNCNFFITTNVAGNVTISMLSTPTAASDNYTATGITGAVVQGSGVLPVTIPTTTAPLIVQVNGIHVNAAATTTALNVAAGGAATTAIATAITCTAPSLQP